MNTGRHLVTNRSVIPKNRQPCGQPTVPERDLPEYRCHSLYGTSKALEIFRKSSRKGIASANRMQLKTRVVTKTPRVFQKLWLLKQHLRQGASASMN